MRAFLSYQTNDRRVAAEVRAFLESVAVPSFMAHDDINVSHEWQQVILGEIVAADIFIAILSRNYLDSHYCLQESGIAVLRQPKMTIIPLSLDKTVPPGFMARIQARPVVAGKVSHAVLFEGLVKYDKAFAVDCMINRLGGANSYAAAQEAMELLHPFLDKAKEAQKIDILEAAAANPQLAHSWGCHAVLRELLESHGRYIPKQDRDYLARALER